MVKFRHIRPIARLLLIAIGSFLLVIFVQNIYMVTTLRKSNNDDIHDSILIKMKKNLVHPYQTSTTIATSVTRTEPVRDLSASASGDGTGNANNNLRGVISISDKNTAIFGSNNDKGEDTAENMEESARSDPNEADNSVVRLQQPIPVHDGHGMHSNSVKGPAALGLDTILLIIASNRPNYLQRTLEAVVKHHPRKAVPIVVSEDGFEPAVRDVVAKAVASLAEVADSSVTLSHWHRPANRGEFFENGYFRLAEHFKWALNQVFGSTNAKRVIILEEDIEIAPDFFEFFAAVQYMLDTDETLLAASAWNDNGFKELVHDNKQLYRSDFFPGLGWMMTRKLWDELSVKWPRAYWDDWLREPVQRKGRHIIRPEVCRSLHFGVKGVSNSQYGEFLSNIELNGDYVPFTNMDLSYLSQPTWDETYVSSVYSAPLITPDQFNGAHYEEVRVEYTRLEGPGASFTSLAHWAGAMDNIKAKVPRTAYKGIVSVWKEGVKVHIAPRERL